MRTASLLSLVVLLWIPTGSSAKPSDRLNAEPALPTVRLAQAGPSAPEPSNALPTPSGTISAPLGNPAPAGITAGATDAPPGGTRVEVERVRAHAPPSASGSRQQALELKKNSANIIEVQPQSEIQKLPDVSVAEALQRVSGVSLETDSGEGRFVNIRGLDADLNGVSFDGVRLQPSNIGSPLGGGRAIALDNIPAGFVGGLEVIKTLRPDQDAEALGGAINIVPRTPAADGRPFVDINAGGGYEPLRGTPVVQGGITAGGSFGLDGGGGLLDPQSTADHGFFSNAKPFSFIGTATQYNDQRGVDDVEESYLDQQGSGVPDKALGEIDLRRYEYHRRRYSRGGALEYNPDPNNHFFFRFSDAGYTEHVKRHVNILTGLGNGCDTTNCYGGSYGSDFIAPAATAEQTLRDESESLRENVVEWGGRNVLAGGVEIDYRGAFASGDYNKPYDYNTTFTNPNTVSVAYNNLLDPYHISVRTLDGTSLANPANYVLSGIGNSQQRADDHEWSGVANVSIPVDLAGIGVARLGGSARLRQHQSTTTFQNYTANPDLPVGESGYVFGPNQVYYDGRYNIGPMIDGSVHTLIGTPALTRNVAADILLGQQAYQNDHENVFAGYGQYDWQRGELGILAGLRVEGTDAAYGANQIVTDTGGNVTVTPARVNADYVDYFPSIQARYALAPDTIARLAYSTAIARPGFNQITASTNVDIGTGIISRGNPSLAPTTSDNFDISFERYLPHGGLISVGAFDKQFHNYILPSQVQGTYPGIAGIAQFISFSNGGEARATGVELQLIKRFTFLPAPLNGFGIDSNYTFVNSEIMIRPGQTGSLPSTSPNNFNVALTFDRGPIDIRVATAFVSRNLYAIGSSRATDIFSAPRFRIDVGSSYAITPHVGFYLDVKNLTDTPMQFTEGPTNSRPIQREFYDATYLAGLRSSF
jgi:TonB-dependent receptor